MENYFICPCCGYKSFFSKKIVEEIVRIVCEYFQTTPERMRCVTTWQQSERDARRFSAYFLMKMFSMNRDTVAPIIGLIGPSQISKYMLELERPRKEEAAKLKEIEKIIRYDVIDEKIKTA